MLADFLKGFSCLVSGTRHFYGDTSLWKYAALPLALMAFFYGAILYGTFMGAQLLANHVGDWTANFPPWLHWASSVLSSMALAFCMLFVLVLLFTALTTVYEFFGGFFFDYLLDAYDERRYGCKPPSLPFAIQAACIMDSMLYCLKTLFVMLLLLFLGPFPILGQIIFCCVMGYMYGMSFLLIVGFRHGLRAQTVKALAHGRQATVMGFGLVAYLILMLVPFAIFVLLPGMVIGSAILFHDLFDGQSLKNITEEHHD